MVFTFIITICPASDLNLKASLVLMHIFMPYSCLSGANEACVTSVLICHFSCHVPSLKGKSSDMNAECVRMRIKRKERRGETGESGWRVPHHPSLTRSRSSPFSPTIHPFSFSEMCWLTALMQGKLSLSLLDHVHLHTFVFRCSVHTAHSCMRFSPRLFFQIWPRESIKIYTTYSNPNAIFTLSTRTTQDQENNRCIV